MTPLSRPRLHARPRQGLDHPARPRAGTALLALPVLALLAGCQATPAPTAAHPEDTREAAQLLARLGPDPKVVSVVANGSESWEEVGARLRRACRERYPVLGAEPVVTVVDQREVRREVDLPPPSVSAARPGANGTFNLLPPAPAPYLKPVLTLKKALASCAAPAAPSAATATASTAR